MKQLRLDVTRDGVAVPATVWLPDTSTPAPVVLLGHGGSGHKETERHIRMALRLADRSGLASIAIDGPFHGDRANTHGGPLRYQQRVIKEGATHVHHRMRADWLAALDTAVAAGLVDGYRVGFFGLSMGARYGIPTCAALGPRLRGVVLGKFGFRCSGVMRRMAADELIHESARAITAPTLMHVPWNDVVFPRAGQFELFGLLGARDKELRSRPGGHGSGHPDDEPVWCTHLARHLLPGTASAAADVEPRDDDRTPTSIPGGHQT